MSGNEEFRRAFSVDPLARSTTSHSDRVTGSVSEPHKNDNKTLFAGSAPYHPYGWMPRGAQSCEIIWYDTQRDEARQGTFWEYKTLLRVGYQEIAPSSGHMMLMLFLADVNIMIEGFHLYPLIERIRARECTQIEQYSLRHHQAVMAEKLVEDGETVISSVQTDLGLLHTSNAVKN